MKCEKVRWGSYHLFWVKLQKKKKKVKNKELCKRERNELQVMQIRISTGWVGLNECWANIHGDISVLFLYSLQKSVWDIVLYCELFFFFGVVFLILCSKFHIHNIFVLNSVSLCFNNRECWYATDLKIHHTTPVSIGHFILYTCNISHTRTHCSITLLSFCSERKNRSINHHI